MAIRKSSNLGTEIRVPAAIITLTQELMDAIQQIANVNYDAGYQAGYEQRKSEEVQEKNE